MIAKKEYIGLRISKELKKILFKLAKSNGVSVSGYIDKTLKDNIKKENELNKKFKGKVDVERRVNYDVLGKVVELIEDLLDDSMPKVASPYIHYSAEKDALYVSLTEEDDFDKYYYWGRFCDDVLSWDNEQDLKVFAVKLRELAVIIENRLNAGG